MPGLAPGMFFVAEQVTLDARRAVAEGHDPATG
jgi:hypothetical protein